MKKRIGFLLPLLIMLTLACNLSTSPTSQAPGNGNQPGNGSNPKPGGTPPANPVNINDGLSSLNSYQMTINFKSIGPDPTQSSTITTEIQHSKDTDATYTNLSMSSIKKGGGEPSNTNYSVYRIGNNQCAGSGADLSWTSMTPNQREMLDLTKSMLGMTPLIDNPTFVAQETVNGIPSNHFTFKVSGLGAKSGAAVNTNRGDYWLAVDGKYIVKYALVVDTSMDPQTNVLHEEISIELTQVNQPINIAFPQTCLDASKVTPTP